MLSMEASVRGPPCSLPFQITFLICQIAYRQFHFYVSELTNVIVPIYWLITFDLPESRVDKMCLCLCGSVADHEHMAKLKLIREHWNDNRRRKNLIMFDQNLSRFCSPHFSLFWMSITPLTCKIYLTYYQLLWNITSALMWQQ